MTDTITRDDLARMIASAADQVREHHAMLSELDSASGDGDHGSAMMRSVDRLQKVFGPAGPADIKTCFHQAGWEVMGADGGASSALLGSFFLGMADGVPESVKSMDCPQLAAAFEAGLRAVCKQTKAQIGDKTMMDALIPAVEAMRAAAQAGKNHAQAMGAAATSAKSGAESTANLTARFGRARFLGERTRGHRDPGAVSIALLFEGFFQGLARPIGGSTHG
jgi:phosphoenolpyruvate---glycerone phosphotransferase subunit DhaL